MKFLMKCGCVNQGTTNGKPICITHECEEIEQELPNLEGRIARCSCGRIKKSRFNLAFFVYKPKEKYDRYYCGCEGWD